MNSACEVLEYFPNQWASLSGVEARREFRSSMAVRERRVEFLAGTSGIDPDGSDVSLAKLSEWMWSEIEPSPSNAVVPDPYWRSMARDVGLYAGETFVARWPQLKWDLVTSHASMSVTVSSLTRSSGLSSTATSHGFSGAPRPRCRTPGEDGRASHRGWSCGGDQWGH